MKLVSVETPEKSVCKMTFSATAEELETGAQAVYERTRANYTIKGFEKGQADRSQIEADRGEHAFWYDAINDIMDRDVPALYEQAVADNRLEPVNEPAYDLVSVKKDEGFVATATVALKPELTVSQYTGFTVKCAPNPVTEKEIDHFMERHQNANAELVPHKGPAVKGNVVHITYVGFVDNQRFKGGEAANQEMTLGTGRMIPGFEEAILGHKAGDDFDISVTFPVNYHARELAGKPAVFKAKLIDVCVRQLPALNSDFAKKVGKVDTMEEFRANVRKQFEDMKRSNAMNRAKTQVLEQLSSHTEGELPDILTDHEYANELQQFQQQLQMQRMPMEAFLRQIKKTKEEFYATLRASAASKLRVRMALLQIAEKENLVPTEAELDANIAEQAERAKKTVEEISKDIDRRALSQNLARKRAADFVIEHSTIEEV